MRLNFSACDEERIAEGIARIGAVVRERASLARASTGAAGRALMRVAVLRGGRSLERAVSQRSGARVELALRRLGHDPLMLDADASSAGAWPTSGSTRAIVAIHGRDGEDGTVQELLELAGVPYAGAGPGSRVRRQRQDRHQAPPARRRPSDRRVRAGLGAAPCATSALTPCSARIGERVGLPLVVKPARGGSRSASAASTPIGAARGAARRPWPTTTMRSASGFVAGREIAVTVLADAALPAVEAIPQGAEGYDFDARYTPGATRVRRAGRDRPGVGRGARLAAAALIGCGGFARVDLLLPPTGRRRSSS